MKEANNLNPNETQEEKKPNKWHHGRFVDNPKQRENILKTAPRSIDKYGNPQIKIGHYWCSTNFERFWQIIKDEFEEDDYLIVVRVADGRFFSKARHEIRRAKQAWYRRIRTQWYLFVDPVTQEIYR